MIETVPHDAFEDFARETGYGDGSFEEPVTDAPPIDVDTLLELTSSEAWFAR